MRLRDGGGAARAPAHCVFSHPFPPLLPPLTRPPSARSLCSSAAEQERDGGVSPRVSPMMRVADAGNLLAGAGFGLPLVDTDSFTIEFPSAAALFEHLRAMGESNAALGARPGVRRDTLLATAAAYSRYSRFSSWLACSHRQPSRHASHSAA